MEKMSDEELALSYIKGNNAAFDELLLRNQSKVYSYILFVAGNREEAEDFFQETFVKVISKLQEGRYSPSGKFVAWCMRIAHNLILDHYRERRARKVIEPTEDNDLSNISTSNYVDFGIEGQYVNEQVLADVRKLMNRLPAPQREVVYMRFYQQMSFKEIAETTNVSINTALGRMRYALINLRKMARSCDLQLFQLA